MFLFSLHFIYIAPGIYWVLFLYINLARQEGGWMANYENIRDKGFDKRTTNELRIIASKGGKASGEARRKKANFRKTLNLLLSAKIENEELTPFLESLGIDSTLESAINMAMIKKALKGDVKAYEAVARFAGQYEVPDEDIREKEADIELKRARKQQITGENETDEALDRLDAILKEMRDNAVKQEAE